MQVTTVGLDLAKNIFQVHGIDNDGEVIFNRALRRAQVLAFFERLEPCLVGIEACGTEPPPLKWSALIVRKRRTINGHQETQARRDCREVTAG
jgi:hypothetical protein